jgi:recombinational DNA repair ATPase RecF
MKLLSVAVENFRVIKNASIAFDPSRTVVGGNQEFGKSTLVEAIHNAFFLKSRGTSGSHKAMRSDLHPGHPSVTLSFETGGRKYTIKKTFAGNAAASSTILVDEGLAAEGVGDAGRTDAGRAAGGRTLRGDEAEACIHELLRAEHVGARTVDSRLRMQWAHLWVWQGTSGNDPVSQSIAEKPAEQLRDRLGRLGGGGVLESSLDARASREIDGRHAAHYRNDGGVKAGSSLARADEEHARADTAFADATRLVATLDAAVETIDAAERTIAAAETKLQAHTAELHQVIAKLREVGDLRIRLAEELATAREAKAAHDEILASDAEINDCNAQLATLVASIEPAVQRLADLATAEEAASQALGDAFDTVDSGSTRQQQAATTVALLELCEQRARLTVERHGLGGRCTRIGALRTKISALEAERKELPAITGDDLARLDKLERARDAAAATLQAIATKVELTAGSRPVQLAGELLGLATAVTITAESELIVGPPGDTTVVRISPGGGRSLADATRASQAADRDLSAALDGLRIESVAQARQTLARLQAIEADIAAQQGAIDGLGGDQAHRELEALVTKIASVEAEIRRRAPADFDIDAEFPLPAGLSASVGDPAADAALDPIAAAMRQAEAVKAVIHAKLVAAHADRDAASAEAARASAAATAARKRHDEAATSRRNVAESIQTTRASIDSLTARRDLLVERCGADRTATIEVRSERAHTTAAAATATQEKLEALNPDSLAREQTRLERAIKNHQSQRHDAETARQVAREKLRREGTDDPREDVARAAVRRRLAAAALANARREAEATKLLASLFTAKKRAVESQFVAPLSSRVADYLRTVLGPDTAVDIGYSGGQFGGLSVSRGEFGNVSWDFSNLSGGTREQVGAAFRLAMAEILAEGHDGTLPIIFDDAFTNTDATRQQKLQRLLDLAADRGLQVIVFSCTPDDYAGLGARLVSLPCPIQPCPIQPSPTTSGGRPSGGVPAGLSGPASTDTRTPCEPAD